MEILRDKIEVFCYALREMSPSPLIEALPSLFTEKLIEDDREPVATIEIPGFEGSFGVYPPALIFWKQLLLVCLPNVVSVSTNSSDVSDYGSFLLILWSAVPLATNSPTSCFRGCSVQTDHSETKHSVGLLGGLCVHNSGFHVFSIFSTGILGRSKLDDQTVVCLGTHHCGVPDL